MSQNVEFKTVSKVKRSPGDIALKVLYGALTSISATAVIGIAAYFGVTIPAVVASAIVTICGFLGGYIKSEVN